jgi:inorganic pyrophosphatase
VLIPSQPIGLVRVLQEERSGKRVRNDRVIAVPASLAHPTDVSALPSRLRDELAWFFKVVGEMNKNWVKVEGWEPAGVAEREIDRLSRPRE